MATAAGASRAADAEFDIREDEEQAVKMQNTIDLLLAAGYFRARIKALPPFDRVVGGMVWCITLCNTVVDVDLIYSENSSIGQKIALTEKVVEVLPQLKCPHSIEPHQIQGLDFINIYPVVQWLVKQAMDAKKKYGDIIRNHAIYQFKTNYFSQAIDEVDKEEEFAKSYRQVKSMFAPRRIYRRPDTFRCSDFREDVHCTLMEYGWKMIASERSSNSGDGTKSDPGSAEEKMAEHFEGQLLKGDKPSSEKKVSTSKLAKIIDTADLRKAAEDVEKMLSVPLLEENDPAKRLVKVQDELTMLEEEEQRLDELLASAEATSATLAKKVEEKERHVASLRTSEERVEENELLKYKKLMEAYNEIKNRESRFKADCKRQLQRMDAELERLQNFNSSSNEEEDIVNQRRKYEAALSKLNEVRDEDAQLNREIAVAQRKLDSVPSQIEITQYQRRILELYNQMAVKNRELKQLYNLHNTLVTVVAFKNKQIDLMNSIEESQEKAKKESYKQSFLDNMQRVSTGIAAINNKETSRCKELEAPRDELRKEYQYMLQKERLYYKTVDDFKEECQHNEELLKKLEELGFDVEE